MALRDTVALITGAGRGIGRGIALAFAGQGCDIAAVARTTDEIEETADAVRRLGRRALAIACDVTVSHDVSEAVRTVEKALGPVDILVNNAGYGSFKPFVDTDEGVWRRTIDVNLTGPFLCIQAVLPGMMARRRGRIINISSVAGLKPIAEQSAYCASKHGLNGLTKVLAMEMRPYGIGVHAICPGGVDTRLARENMPDRDKTNWLQPEDIAHVALFLATQSPRAATDEIVVRRFDSVPIGG